MEDLEKKSNEELNETLISMGLEPLADEDRETAISIINQMS